MHSSVELSPKQKRKMVLAGGSWNPELTTQVASAVGIEETTPELRRFANGERYARYPVSVRNRHVHLLQSVSETSEGSVNDALFELYALIDAARKASASSITAYIPNFPYARQDRKARGREPIMASVVTRTLGALGADSLVSIDLHSQQIQGSFEGTFDHLTAEPLIRGKLEHIIRKKESKGYSSDDFVIVSPDEGRAKESAGYANRLGIEIVHIPKSRDSNDSSKLVRPESVSGVEGKVCIVIDDMIDTAGTIVSAAYTLRNSGAEEIIVCATHGIFSEPALERLGDSEIDRIVVTDTVPQVEAQERLGSTLKVLPIGPLLGTAMTEIVGGGSLSELFEGRNFK